MASAYPVSSDKGTVQDGNAHPGKLFRLSLRQQNVVNPTVIVVPMALSLLRSGCWIRPSPISTIVLVGVAPSEYPTFRVTSSGSISPLSPQLSFSQQARSPNLYQGEFL